MNIYPNAGTPSCVDVAVAAAELARRPTRTPDHEAENRALATLAQEMTANPHGVLQKLAELVIELCHADSAGVSILEPGGENGIFRWHAAAGRFAAHPGDSMPRDASPCGIVISRNTVLLFNEAERYFPALRGIAPRIYEHLLAPWTVHGHTIGAVWAIGHSPDKKFDAEDARVLQSLASFAAAAYQTVAALDEAKTGRRELERRVEERTRQLSQTNEELRQEIEQRRQAQAALRESEARFRRALQPPNIGVIFFDTQGAITAANDAFLRMSGYSREEVAEGCLRWDRMTPPEWMENSLRAIEEFRSKGSIAPYEKEYIRKDGSRWRALFAGTRLSHNEGVEYVIDITEQKRAERALRESEEKYRRLFTTMEQGFCVIEKVPTAAGEPIDFRYIEVNQAFERHTGLHDVVGKTILQVVPQAERSIMDLYDKVVRTGEPQRFVAHVAALDLWMETEVFPAQAPGQIAVLFSNVSDRKHAEIALRESEARFRALADASPALIWQLDAQGQAVYVNRRYAEMTGLALEQLLGTGWHAIVHPDDFPGYLAMVGKALCERTAFQTRFRIQVKDGLWHWFEAHSAPWFSANGEYRGHVGISIDVTEAVKGEETLREADRRKDEFLAILAHELRNPLAPISNVVRLLRRADGRRATDRLFEMVERQVQQIVKLVDDLLEISRITRGKIELDKQDVALADVVRSAVETSRPLIDQARHQLTVSLPEQPVILDADSVRLTQVLVNLLNNAAKYTDAGGQIWLSARREGGDVVISVRDSGIGIPGNQLPNIFEMFTQVHRASGRSQGGLGIGLTMVRDLVEMHGGTVRAHSAGPGQGSEFIVRLPVRQAMRAEDDRLPAVITKAPLSGQRILVVDDNRDAADSLTMLLEFDGAEVRTAYDGQSALALLETMRPHTVLLDLGMPGMDGYEVAQRIHQDARFHDTRIVALTGWGQETDRNRTRNCGFDFHLTKPVDFGMLESWLTGVGSAIGATGCDRGTTDAAGTTAR